MTLTTARLLLRPWRDADIAPFAAMNADPQVMQYFPRLQTADETSRMVEYIRSQLELRGFGLWAVEIPGIAEFAGFIGLSVPTFESHFTPCVEIGWRMMPQTWGKGYATEGANAALSFGFETLGLEEIVSFTSPLNVPSVNVMKRLGMTHDPTDDFDHPRVAEGHPLRRHVLYRKRRA